MQDHFAAKPTSAMELVSHFSMHVQVLQLYVIFIFVRSLFAEYFFSLFFPENYVIPHAPPRKSYCRTLVTQ